MINSLSGRFLILTVIFVMIAEVFIFVPSVARFRQEYLQARVEKAQIASLSVLASEQQILSPELEEELLNNAGVYNVVLRRDAVRQLVLSSTIPGPISTVVDLRDPSPWHLIAGAMRQLFTVGDGVVRVMGYPTQAAGELIEVTMPQAPLRQAMLTYGLNVMILSAAISTFSAALLFVAVGSFMVRPIKRVVSAMQSYSEAPEDARRVIVPKTNIRELRAAEDALAGLQTQLTGALKQKERLAQLGGAVAKISHDLRNILTTATLLADRMERSEDPAVKRSAPKLVSSLGRAVNLCESTLAFGRVEEPPPALSYSNLKALVVDVLEGERLATDDTIDLNYDIPADLTIRSDPEQLFRVLGNLVRNARQAIAATRQPGQITVAATETERNWLISVSDTGPGLPKRAQEHLFTPFEGGVRQGGSGLGLSISAELIKGHGGALKLTRTGPTGTEFTVYLPKGVVAFGQAAE